jgi:hypothetical protein
MFMGATSRRTWINFGRRDAATVYSGALKPLNNAKWLITALPTTPQFTFQTT